METWRERVVMAKARGAFLQRDVEDAAHWGTCAIGEQYAKHPGVIRWNGSVAAGPADPFLEALGDHRGFRGALERSDVAAAHDILDKIEDRVIELKLETESGL